MRIYDTVIISEPRELDLLDARMTELSGFDEVIHVICEAAADYHGDMKDLHFMDSSLAGKWRGKWNHVRVEASELPENAEPKIRKDALREYLWDGIHGEPGDLVMHGSPDEIPSARAVRALLSGEASVPVVLQMRWCAFTAGQVHPRPWLGTAVRQMSKTGSFAGMREERNQYPRLLGGGTRLSMMGQQGSVHPDGHHMWDTDIDESWPSVVVTRDCPQDWLVR